jgi:hypothetical protein
VTTASDTWRQDWCRGTARALGIGLDAGQLEAAAKSEGAGAEAYEALLLGLGYMRTAKGGAADSALAAFDDAIAMDSTFVSAHVERAGNVPVPSELKDNVPFLLKCYFRLLAAVLGIDPEPGTALDYYA